jgi:hypothetical protein
MNINKLFKSNYLRAADIESDNLTVTIEEVREEIIGQDKDSKPVVYFKGLFPGLVLNKTNANTITEVLGTPETDEWIGRQITLYPAEVEYQGKMVESIRVRLRAPRTATQAATATATTPKAQTNNDDDLPF